MIAHSRVLVPFSYMNPPEPFQGVYSKMQIFDALNENEFHTWQLFDLTFNAYLSQLSPEELMARLDNLFDDVQNGLDEAHEEARRV